MKYLRQLVEGLEVAPVVQEIEAAPELWNEYKLRTEYYGGQHAQVSDIWVRFNAWENLQQLRAYLPEAEAVARFVSEPHQSVWYPGSDKLPSLKDLAFELMRHFRVEQLGGILVTRIPPGCEVKPHVDGGWHATYYEKLAVQLKSAPEQAFCFEDGEFACPPGTVYAFDNSHMHHVYNRSATEERMTLFICVKRDVRLPPLSRGG